MTENMAGAARSVGFSIGTINQRRRKFTDFEEKLEAALEDAEIALEYRLAFATGGFGGLEFEPGAEGGTGPESAQAAMPLFDPDLAMRFLKWREEKRRGRVPKGRDSRRQPPMSLEQHRASILRKVAAVKRQSRAQQLAQGGQTTKREA